MCSSDLYNTKNGVDYDFSVVSLAGALHGMIDDICKNNMSIRKKIYSGFFGNRFKNGLDEAETFEDINNIWQTLQRTGNVCSSE